MKHSINQFSVLLIFLLVFNTCAKKDNFPLLEGPYLGQKPPGLSAELFAPGIISTGNIEKSLVFSPDGDEVYWAVLGDAACFIATMKCEINRWTSPRIASFSGDYFDLEFGMSQDGQSIYFASENRPINGRPRDDGNIWIVRRTFAGWSEPRSVGQKVNSHAGEFSPSVTQDGTLYFYRRSKDGGDWDIYSARLEDGEYTEPVRLDAPVNFCVREFDPYVAPDESFLIFCSVGREDGYGDADLYISFRKADGTWGEAMNLGERVNSSRWEFCPTVSPDGKFLFFASNRRFRIDAEETDRSFAAKMKILDQELNGPGNGHSDFYWVDSKIIEELRPKF